MCHAIPSVRRAKSHVQAATFGKQLLGPNLIYETNLSHPHARQWHAHWPVCGHSYFGSWARGSPHFSSSFPHPRRLKSFSRGSTPARFSCIQGASGASFWCGLLLGCPGHLKGKGFSFLLAAYQQKLEHACASLCIPSFQEAPTLPKSRSPIP